jgi:hypothetical protein
VAFGAAVALLVRLSTTVAYYSSTLVLIRLNN